MTLRIDSLATLLRGTWSYRGDATGTTTIDWLQPGFFLVQRGTLTVLGECHSAFEIIGHHKPFGAPSPDTEITSRAYTDVGDTLDYTWELDVDRLTIWGGPKGSPAAAIGSISQARDQITGRWSWPGGGYCYEMIKTA